MYLLNEWTDGSGNDSECLANYKELHGCKQVLLATNSAVFMRLCVANSPEQAVGVEAEGGVELGFGFAHVPHWADSCSSLGQGPSP